MIYVTVGTMFLDFPRLIRKMDEIAAATDEKVIMQKGMGSETPTHCEWFDFRPYDEVVDLQREARVVVCHAGIGCVCDALRAKRPLIVVPRQKRFNEHTNDHQLELARAVQERDWGRMILDINDLEGACRNPPPAYENYSPARSPLVADLRQAVQFVAELKGRRC